MAAKLMEKFASMFNINDTFKKKYSKQKMIKIKF